MSAGGDRIAQEFARLQAEQQQRKLSAAQQGLMGMVQSPYSAAIGGPSQPSLTVVNAETLTDLQKTNTDLSARLHALETRLASITASLSDTDPKKDVAAVAAAQDALLLATNSQLAALNERIATLDRRLTTFNQTERYAITRAMVTAIMSEAQPKTEPAP